MTTILVADDEDNIRNTLRDILKLEGYRVVTAASGEEVLALLKESVPNLMILDIMMPEPDGASLFTDLRRKEEFRNIPIIFVSGMVASDIDPALFSGRERTWFLSKPVQVEKLLATVEEALRA